MADHSWSPGNLAIEETALRAWPALEQTLYDGWLLRFSQGYTKRANSVNPLYASTLDPEAKLESCELAYRSRGLPPVFRLTPFASPPQLDQLLEERGYTRHAPTQVLTLELAGCELPPVQDGTLEPQGLDDWLGVFCHMRGAPLQDHQAHRAILAAIDAELHLAAFMVSGEPLACGLVVLDGRYVGIFDLITTPDHRNRGYGRQLVSGLLAWARSNGARTAYLQVMLNNAPARHLYRKLGLGEAYRYWYRVPGKENN